MQVDVPVHVTKLKIGKYDIDLNFVEYAKEFRKRIRKSCIKKEHKIDIVAKCLK